MMFPVQYPRAGRLESLRRMQLDGSHITVGVLQRLAPELFIAGGSFAAWLPHPGTLSPDVRPLTFKSAQDAAVEQCVEDLVLKAGLARSIKVATGEGGERLWPADFVGSLTDKGTVVLGGIARKSAIRMLGIDLEHMDRSDLSIIANTVAAEGLPAQDNPNLGTLFSFSAKEAVFKAQYSLSRRRLTFSDVRLRWGQVHEGVTCADVDYEGPPGMVVRCAAIQEWILSVALSII